MKGGWERLYRKTSYDRRGLIHVKWKIDEHKGEETSTYAIHVLYDGKLVFSALYSIGETFINVNHASFDKSGKKLGVVRYHIILKNQKIKALLSSKGQMFFFRKLSSLFSFFDLEYHPLRDDEHQREAIKIVKDAIQRKFNQWGDSICPWKTSPSLDDLMFPAIPYADDVVGIRNSSDPIFLRANEDCSKVPNGYRAKTKRGYGHWRDSNHNKLIKQLYRANGSACNKLHARLIKFLNPALEGSRGENSRMNLAQIDADIVNDCIQLRKAGWKTDHFLKLHELLEYRFSGFYPLFLSNNPTQVLKLLGDEINSAGLVNIHQNFIDAISMYWHLYAKTNCHLKIQFIGIAKTHHLLSHVVNASASNFLIDHAYKELDGKQVYSNQHGKWLTTLTPSSKLQMAEWGRKLNNCVGSYAEKVVHGSTVVFALVDEDEQVKVAIQLGNNGSFRQAQSSSGYLKYDNFWDGISTCKKGNPVNSLGPIQRWVLTKYRPICGQVEYQEIDATWLQSVIDNCASKM